MIAYGANNNNRTNEKKPKVFEKYDTFEKLAVNYTWRFRTSKRMVVEMLLVVGHVYGSSMVRCM